MKEVYISVTGHFWKYLGQVRDALAVAATKIPPSTLSSGGTTYPIFLEEVPRLRRTSSEVKKRMERIYKTSPNPPILHERPFLSPANGHLHMQFHSSCL